MKKQYKIILINGKDILYLSDNLKDKIITIVIKNLARF